MTILANLDPLTVERIKRLADDLQRILDAMHTPAAPLADWWLLSERKPRHRVINSMCVLVNRHRKGMKYLLRDGRPRRTHG